MYDDKKIKRIVKKVCDEANVTTNIHPNGERAEGYSFIVTGMLYSWVIDALIKAINEAFPDADPLGKQECCIPGLSMRLSRLSTRLFPMQILLELGGYRTEGCRFRVLESKRSSMTRAWKSG